MLTDPASAGVRSVIHEIFDARNSRADDVNAAPGLAVLHFLGVFDVKHHGNLIL
jgi:hypothetical protein